jgi:hypothetical protein
MITCIFYSEKKRGSLRYFLNFDFILDLKKNSKKKRGRNKISMKELLLS